MDTLRDEGIEYAQKLMEAGIPTELNVIKGAYHGFDEDYSSNLVKSVLLHRCEVIKKMLNY
jgi:acetyl esterase/lipase